MWHTRGVGSNKNVCVWEGGGGGGRHISWQDEPAMGILGHACNFEILKILLLSYSSIKARSHASLHSACINGNLTIAKYLITPHACTGVK